MFPPRGGGIYVALCEAHLHDWMLRAVSSAAVRSSARVISSILVWYLVMSLLSAELSACVSVGRCDEDRKKSYRTLRSIL